METVTPGTRFAIVVKGLGVNALAAGSRRMFPGRRWNRNVSSGSDGTGTVVIHVGLGSTIRWVVVVFWLCCLRRCARQRPREGTRQRVSSLLFMAHVTRRGVVLEIHNVGVVTLGPLKFSTRSAIVAVTAGVVLVILAAAVVVQGIAMETATVENLSLLVINGDHLEQFLLVTFPTASHTLPSLQPGGGQFRFRNDGSRAIEIGSYVIHFRQSCTWCGLIVDNTTRMMFLLLWCLSTLWYGG